MTTQTPLKWSDLMLAVAGLIGIITFVLKYSQTYPEAGVAHMITREEALGRARQILDDLAIVPKGNQTRQETVEQHADLIQYLQERYGLRRSIELFDHIPVYTWRLEWSNPEEGNVRIGRSSSSEDEGTAVSNRDRIVVELDGRGRLTALTASLAVDSGAIPTPELETPRLPVPTTTTDSARALVLDFLSRTAFDAAGLREKNVKNSSDQRSESFEFTFVSTEKKFGLGLEITAGIVNGRLTQLQSAWSMPPDFTKPGDRVLNKAREWSSLILIFLISVLTIVYFLTRFRSGAFDYRLGIFFGLVTTVAFSVMMTVQLWQVSRMALILVVILGGGLWALVSGVIVAVSASVTREAWPEKYQTFEAIRRGLIFNKAFGASVVRGCLWSFVILGLGGLILHILPASSFLPKVSCDSKLQGQGAIYLIGAGLYSAIGSFHAYSLMTMSMIRRKTSNPVWVYAGGILVNFLAPYVLGGSNPAWTHVAMGLVVAAIFAHILIQHDFLALITAGLVTYLIQEGFVFAAAGDPLQTSILIAFVLAFLVIGFLGLMSRTGGEEILDYVPEYVQELETKRRIHREFEIARAIQSNFLCCKVPHSTRYDIATVCAPAYEVGGDYYDFIRLGDHDSKLGVIIGDVSGKGVSAAFYMTLIKGIIQTQATITIDSPRLTLARANDIFCEHVERSKFISMIYGIFDFEKRHLILSRAGHNPLLVKQSARQEAERHLPKGIAIGLAKGDLFLASLEEVKIPFQENDVFAFYTDGFSEAMNRQGEEFGEARLYDIIQRHSLEPSASILAAVQSGIDRFVGNTPQHDDMTMIVVRVTG